MLKPRGEGAIKKIIGESIRKRITQTHNKRRRPNMPMINDYQKGWALRYIREAKAELIAAQKNALHGSKPNLRSREKSPSSNLLQPRRPRFHRDNRPPNHTQETAG